MPNSVIIDRAECGEIVPQGFTSKGIYSAAAPARITVSHGGTAKYADYPAGNNAPWEIPFDGGTPNTGSNDLMASISGAGASNDQSDDVEVVLSAPLEEPILTDNRWVRIVSPTPAGTYTVSGIVNDGNGVLVVCLVQRMYRKSKQARTVFATASHVVDSKWSGVIQIPNHPGGNKRLVLRVLLINKNSKVIGTITSEL